MALVLSMSPNSVVGLCLDGALDVLWVGARRSNGGAVGVAVLVGVLVEGSAIVGPSFLVRHTTAAKPCRLRDAVLPEGNSALHIVQAVGFGHVVELSVAVADPGHLFPICSAALFENVKEGTAFVLPLVGAVTDEVAAVPRKSQVSSMRLGTSNLGVRLDECSTVLVGSIEDMKFQISSSRTK